MLNWIKYSGASLAITFNPLHWRVKPRFSRFMDEWVGPHESSITVSWLFLTVRVWLDDGSW